LPEVRETALCKRGSPTKIGSEESAMARYMYIARYDSAGVQGVLAKGGSARAAVIEKAAADAGGRMVTFDFAFGEDDVFTLCELPDNRAAAAVALAVNSTGLAHVRTVVLMSPEDVDAAAKQQVSYTAPGR
jgi:uncharacterized protein with GYD domain